ncbi:MAG: glycosyltransferase family 2 protein [Anaerolineae bacterium]
MSSRCEMSAAPPPEERHGRPDQPQASVIIPNWNGLRYLRPCLASLQAQTWPSFEVIVVDNASTDGSAETVRREFPDVRVLALSKNGGYSGGCNAGIGAARGDVVVFLNNDIEAEPTWLEALLGALDRHPDAGSAASRMMLYDQPTHIHSAGDTYGVDGLPDSRGVWQPYGPPYDQERYVFGGCGGALAYRKEVLEDIGLFDERFFMYCEDVDLNWRAQLAGYRCIYTPDAVVRHHLSATGGGSLASYYVGRNTLWVIARNYPPRLFRRYKGQILRAQWRIAKDALRSIRGKAARARLRGQLAGLLTAWRWRHYRQALMARRRVSDAYIASILERPRDPDA